MAPSGESFRNTFFFLRMVQSFYRRFYQNMTNHVMGSLADHDRSRYAAYSVNDRGSPVYTCSLDAEGAFDAIPHVVIFGKLDGIVPDYAWRVMYAYYRQMYVTIRLHGALGQRLPVRRGTGRGLAKKEKIPKIRNYYGSWWEGPGLTQNFFCGKSSQNSPKPVLIF